MRVELERLEPRYHHLRILDNKDQLRLAASLEHYGQMVPVLVVETLENPSFVLIDGYRRRAAAEQLGWDGLEVLVLPAQEREALLLHRQLQRTQGSAIEDGWYLTELVESYGMSQQELAVQFGCSSAWISRRLSLVRDLPEEVQQAVRIGRLPADAAMKTLVPLSRGKEGREAARQIVAGWQGRIRGADLRTVVLGWSQADAEGRAAILRAPRRFAELEAALGAEHGVDLGVEAEPLAKDPHLTAMRSLAGICGRLRRNLGSPSGQADADPRTRSLWRRAMATAWADLGRALALLETTLTREGVLHAAGP